MVIERPFVVEGIESSNHARDSVVIREASSNALVSAPSKYAAVGWVTLNEHQRTEPTLLNTVHRQ